MTAIRITGPFTDAVVVVVGGQSAGGNSGTEHEALAKAETEMQRNIKVLDARANVESAVAPESLSERRLLYFASKEGRALFDGRLDAAAGPSDRIQAPDLLINERVVGPWYRYCRVWRCLFNGELDELPAGSRTVRFYAEL